MSLYRRSFLALTVLLCLKTAIVVFTILYAGIGLGPDEAQYWTWSQNLDFGYYSKPPGIAWEIFSGTALFGNTELGVRTIPLVFGFLFPMLIFLLAKACKLSPNASFWAGVVSALTPMGVLSSFLAITDTGMILAWTAVCVHIARQLEQRQPFNFLVLGLVVFLGALFKWTMFIAWGAVLVCLLCCPWMRNVNAFKNFFFGVLLSLAALLPSIYWNAHHEWATFRHVSSTLTGGHAPSKPHAMIGGNPLEFIGSQAALVSPILIILLLIAWRQMFKIRAKISPAIIFCGLLSFTLLMFGIAASFFMKMQGNWIIFAYPTAFILIAWYCIDISKQAKPWLIAGSILSFVLVSFAFAIPTIQSHSLMSFVKIPNPFRHNVGWDKLSEILTDEGYDPEKNFLFGDKYQMSSILSFYGPKQKRAYFMNLEGTRKNQFSFWPSMAEEQQGKTGYFVVVENAPRIDPYSEDKYEKLLSPYFGKVQFLGKKTLFTAYGKSVKEAFLFRGEDYRGDLPKDPELY